MFEIIKFALTFFLSATILILILNFKFDKIDVSKKNSNFIIFFLIILIISEYWVLGPYSYIKFYDEADTGLSRILYDLNHHTGGAFSHNILGGSDHYASLLLGGQHFSLERLIFSNFPIWIGLAVHKFLLVGVNIIGFYNLIRKLYKTERLHSIIFSIFGVLINPYSTSSTLQHGIGYALIPLAIYVFFILGNKKYYLLYTTTLSTIIALSISLTHSFLVLISGLFLSTLFFKIQRPLKLLLSLLTLILLVLINWSEAILGFYEYGKLTERVVSGEHIYVNLLGSLPFLWSKTNICIDGCSYQFSPLILILGIVFAVSCFNNLKKNIKFIFFISLVIYFPLIIFYVVKLFNLNFLSSISFYNISLFIILPITLMAVKNFSTFKNKNAQTLLVIFIFFGSFLFFDKKFEAAKNILEGQQISKIINIPNLLNRNWNKNEFRVVSVLPYYYYHPNFSWIYNLETLDGYINLAPKNISRYWECGLFKKTCNSDKKYDRGSLYLTYIPFKNPFEEKLIFDENKNILLDKMIDINMLKLVNAKYIFSYHNIVSKNLKLISKPKKNYYEKNFLRRIYTTQRNKNIYIDSFKESLSNLFDTREIYIYEVLDASDKIFFPKKIISQYFSKIDEKFSFISDNYEKNILYTNLTDYKSASGTISKIKKIKNGYEYEISVNQEGLLVINNFYNPFWKLDVNGMISNVINLNDYQIGVIVSKNDTKIKLLYSRETIMKKIKKFIN
jgi:hypothetical protein